MKLSRLLQEHERYADHGLRGNFGDGYLMQKNSVFCRMREDALAAGFVFSDQPDAAYESFPLLQLERWLHEKRIPYTPNTAAFTHLTEGQRAMLEWEDIDGNLKKNLVFHEAVHAGVRERLRDWSPSTAEDALTQERERVLRMLLEEACANTAELFALIDAEDSLHRIFLEMNSYNTLFEVRGPLKQTAALLGREPLIGFMLFAYLLSNQLRPGVGDRDFERMLGLTGLLNADARAKKMLRALAKVAFQLSERFRVQTTAFHLRLMGIATPVPQLFDFDLLSRLESDPAALRFIAQFVSRLA